MTKMTTVIGNKIMALHDKFNWRTLIAQNRDRFDLYKDFSPHEFSVWISIWSFSFCLL